MTTLGDGDDDRASRGSFPGREIVLAVRSQNRTSTVAAVLLGPTGQLSNLSGLLIELLGTGIRP
jgi:hypothetical protein